MKNQITRLDYLNTSIWVGESFEQIQNYLPKHKTVFIITDENVYQHWQSYFEGFSVIVLPVGEAQKSLSRIETIVETLIERDADRNSFLLGVGGGVVCDITGFVASIYMRGIPFAFAPTTLLAQVDAAIGGKNGVNTTLYKNMIGVFKQPKFIFTDINFLQTLPQSIYIDGLAEVIKHACIKSKSYFEFLEQHSTSILAREQSVLYPMILNAIQIKTNVVAADPYEKGERKLLNFGHTFGHAIEKTQNISHGKAVSLGMIIVNQIAVRLSILEPKSSARMTDLLAKVGLPTEPMTDTTALLPILKKDKKKTNNELALILLKDIGESIIYPIDLTQLNTL